MSMDPFATPDPVVAAALEARVEDLRRRQAALESTEAALQREVEGEGAGGWNGQRWMAQARRFEEDRARFEEDVLQLMMDRANSPRRVVFHPALFGRELAWSTARIDFSFNDIAGLSREAEMTNGGTRMPARLLGISIEGAGTWQFFERDARVQLAPGTGRVGALSVVSTGPTRSPASARSHFAISMFGDGAEGSSEGELPRLPPMEAAVQPMLDWLAVNHHDFMRLNDFSEALSLVRWLRGEGVAPVLIDLDGEDPEIATPDRIRHRRWP